MSDDKSKSLDLLGIKPIADSIRQLTAATVDGSAAFLSRICLPAAEEFGLLLRDRVRSWRAANITAITRKAEKNLALENISDDVQAHPRLVFNILEEGSWVEDPEVQDLWAGLLSSSCSKSGDDDSNLIFVNLLGSLTKLQARILNYTCEKSNKYSLSNGLIQAREVHVTIEKIGEISGESNIQRLDRELDHLREIGLIRVGLDPHGDHTADIGPTPLALHMYVRCKGSRASPTDYFNITLPIVSSEEAKGVGPAP